MLAKKALKKFCKQLPVCQDTVVLGFSRRLLTRRVRDHIPSSTSFARERNEGETRIWKRKNERRRARETTSDARARWKSDSILSSKREKETRFEGCKCGANDHLTRETRSIQEKELQQETRAVGALLH